MMNWRLRIVDHACELSDFPSSALAVPAPRGSQLGLWYEFELLRVESAVSLCGSGCYVGSCR